MAKTLTLKFIDGSSKECEVTGRAMGGEDVYYKPFSSLKLGTVNWDTNESIHANHHVNICELGEDYVVVDVISWRGTKSGGPYKLHAGSVENGDYWFGEWEYYYSVSLVWCEN